LEVIARKVRCGASCASLRHTVAGHPISGRHGTTHLRRSWSATTESSASITVSQASSP
jgi:hypothetical protein